MLSVSVAICIVMDNEVSVLEKCIIEKSQNFGSEIVYQPLTIRNIKVIFHIHSGFFVYDLINIHVSSLISK